ncbi:integrin beta-3-like [Convolutriloba macropyga]|uniref:integrin beta-3-like n=1 Tax=Convolutriloba macropyga TaxID=536237 RepID=UPI003F52227A
MKLKSSFKLPAMVLGLSVVLLSAILVTANEDCNYQLTCDDCIKASARCFWCADGNFDDENMPKGRCSSSKDNCPSDAYISTQSSIEPEGDSDEKTLELRDDEAFTFTVQVESQPKLPYEMYFLMDGSRSMLAALDSVKTNSKELARRVTEAWDRSKVGLGLFNDKEAIPFTFVNLTTTKLVKNIPEFEFPFWKMTSGLIQASALSKFNEDIDGITIKKLNDEDNDPEAQIDVIGQAVACKKNLNFEEGKDTRHLIFLVTDSPFWAAGDGRFGGIIQPPDGKCRGSSEQEQSAASILYDYPSVGFLKKQLQQSMSYLVASVTNNEYEQESAFIRSYAKINNNVYTALQNAIPLLAEYVSNTYNSNPNKDDSSSSEMNPLDVEKVMTTLDQISKRVSLVASGDTENFRIKTFIEKGKCPGEGNERLDSAGDVIACSNVPEGEEVPVSISIKVKDGVKLESNKEYKIRFNLPGVHPSKDLLSVTVKHLVAQCEGCEKFDDITLAADDKICNDGKLVCGKCECDKGYHGLRCDCEEEKGVRDPAAGQTLDEGCVGSTMPDKACNGNGVCFCGWCECLDNSFGNHFVGKTCGCDPDSCPKDDDGETCYGRGACICDETNNQMNCECEADDYNPDTNCQCKREKVCMDPSFNDGSICNGRSLGCMCDGSCDCQFGFEGDFCEFCNDPQCKVELCSSDRYTHAALCKLGIYTGNKCQFQEKFNFTELSDETWEKCEVEYDDCRYEFHVNMASILEIRVAPEPVFCDEPIPPWIIVLVVVIAVLIFGLIFIIGWKAYVVYQEKKEYKAFMKAQQGGMVSKGDNPFYREAEQNFQNPNYKGN